MARIFSWEGIAFPFPNINWGFEDISTSDSGRNLSGLMSKKDVAQKRTVDCTWENVPDSVASLVLSNVKSKTYGTLNYPDPEVGANVSKTMYTGSPKSDLVAILDDVCHWTISFSFIEQ